MRVEELAANIETALRNLPTKLRPKEADIGVIALLIAQEPCMSQWQVRDRPAGARRLG